MVRLNQSGLIQIPLDSRDDFLRRLPRSWAFHLVPTTALVVVGYCILIFALADLIQFLLAQRQLSTGPAGKYVILPWLRYIGTPQFFAKEYQYLSKIREQFPGSWFRFKVRRSDVVVVFGDEARKAFFNFKSFTFLDGYLLLHPGMKYLVPKDQKEGKDGFGWFLKQFVRTDVLEHFMHPIVMDGGRLVASLGKEGIMNPFVDLDRAVFSISSRIAAGNEIADDPQKLTAAMRAFSWIHKGSTPSSIILPYIPTPTRFRSVLGGLTLHRMSSKIFQARKKNSSTNRDVLQTLLDEDVSMTQASVLVIMTIFASYTNTSAILCWFYIMLCDNPSWLAKIRVEIDSFMKTHSIKGSSLTDALADIPLDTWEPSLPTLDLCLHECLRLIMNGSIIRRNIGRDVQISGRTIRSGDFLMYMTADAHLDGEMYPEPLKFDPLRDQNKSGRLGFLAWGAGTHPCTGQRLAKLIIKIYSAMLLYTFDIEMVDAYGRPLERAPTPVLGLFNVPKPDTDVHLRYKTREVGSHEKV
ncbi:hypothetical protein AcV7_003678 [Taiwanofungus camphoratus]|nr:hypothetical protein AcV7_003678 [Antrodia cinnamomea]